MQLSDFKHRDWDSLTEWEKQFLRKKGVINGCGGAGKNIKNRFIRSSLQWALKKLRLIFIQADCEYHDFEYWKGVTEFTDEEIDKIQKVCPEAWKMIEEAERERCDMGFFRAIMNDVYLLPRGLLPVVGYAILALIFYAAVRIGGKDYFTYRTCSSSK